MSKEIIIYNLRADENYVSGTLKKLDIGNTEKVASIINRFTNAPMFKLEQTSPYSKNYNECIDEAKADQENNARPELKKMPESLDDFDTIYLGYPNYWSTCPMAVFTFLERFDFLGKRIKAFCTHERSGLGKSLDDIRQFAKNAESVDGLAIYGSRVDKCEDIVKSWINS